MCLMKNGSFQKIGIFSQVFTQECIEIVHNILSIEESTSISFYSNTEFFEFLKKVDFPEINRLKGTSLEDMNVECIVTIGGDGTIIRVAHSRPDIPIISINKGRKGFMAEVEPKNIIPSFKKFLMGKYCLEEHSYVEAFINGKKVGSAINEILISSVDLFKTIDFQLLVDGVITSGSLADGIIVSTAVGSTGHCLSSGGSIVDPILEIFEISWINPLNLAIRPIILSSSRDIKIRCATRINPIKLVIDGQISVEYDTPFEISFKFADETVKFFRLDPFTKRWKHHLHPELRE